VKREELKFEICSVQQLANCSLEAVVRRTVPGISPLEHGVREGESPVLDPDVRACVDTLSKSRVAWECSPKWVVNFHLKLNTDGRPIANKYREGKMKRTLKRELNRA